MPFMPFIVYCLFFLFFFLVFVKVFDIYSVRLICQYQYTIPFWSRFMLFFANLGLHIKDFFALKQLYFGITNSILSKYFRTISELIIAVSSAKSNVSSSVAKAGIGHR